MLLIAIAPAWHLHNFTLYKREEAIIELLTIVSKFDHLTEFRIIDPKSLKSEAGKKFRERHPSARILDVEGQLISLHD